MEFFFFFCAIPKVKINQSEGLAEFPPHPPSAKPEHRIEPRHLLEYLRAETRRKILFSLGKKEIGRAQNEKSKEYFPAGHASEASGGGAERIIIRFAQKMFELRPKNTARIKLFLQKAIELC